MPQPDLFIPHKAMPQVKQPDYKDDMRAIEIWAKGLKSGGTAGAVLFQMILGNGQPSVTFGGFPATILTNGEVFCNFPLFAGDTGYSPNVFSSGTVIDTEIGGGGGYTIPTTAIGYHVMQVPQIFAPSFTGPTSTIGITVFLRAVQNLTTAGASNSIVVTSKQQNLVSQQHKVLQTTDFLAPSIVGTDLSFITATGATVQSAGGLPYMVGWAIGVVWDTANTLTQA